MPEKAADRPVHEQRAGNPDEQRPRPVERASAVEIEELPVDELLAAVDLPARLVAQVLTAEADRESVLRRKAGVIEEVGVIPDQDVEARAEVLAVRVAEDPPGLPDRLQKGEQQRNSRRGEAAQQPAARSPSHLARRPRRPTMPKTTNAGLTGAPYSGTAGAMSADRPITMSPPTAGATTAIAPRTRRTARAIPPTTSQMRPGGKMREASF